MHNKPIKALIVDDEPPARSVIRKMVAEDDEIRVVGECSTGIEAIEAIAKLDPDLLFLDIQMPDLDGFELIESLAGEKIPHIIFVTAFDRYAVRAFEVSPVDYLLKPFDHERMEKALEKAKTDLRNKNTKEQNDQVLSLLNQLRQKQDYLERFVIKKNGRVFFLSASDVDWIESDGNYLYLHAGAEKQMIRGTLKNIESRLDPDKFFRIHRSTIVNLDRIKELQVHFNENHVVVLKDGTELILSRRCRDILSKKLGTQI
ncbi:MAG: LytTR family DNA-binding domain-containing protein [Pyrinomonadaceae bacterium]